MSRVLLRPLLAGLVLALLATPASAQVFGTFTWQMQPYCNLVTLTLTRVPSGYTLDGSDNQCGAAKLAGITGMALINPDGTVGLEFTIVAAPSGKGVHVSASLNPATGSGPWTDSAGNSGTLALGAPGSGNPRPAPTSTDLLGARVDGAARVIISMGATGAAKLGTGGYEVQFNRDVSACVYSATTYESGKAVQQLQERNNNPNAVFLFIKTTDGTNTLIDGTFYVTVVCPRP